MKFIILIAILSISATFFLNYQNTCILVEDDSPNRLVVIKGKATIVNFPDVADMPATTNTIIFQKVGCPSCYIGTNPDADRNYKITVGDGKYKVIIRNPSSPEFDMLVPEQERFIDTETLEAKQHSKQVFDFDIKIRLLK